MINYTLEDLEVLASIYDQTNVALSDEALFKFPNFKYTSLMDDIIKIKKTPRESLIEFIGNHDCVGYTPEKWEEVKSFLFDTSLKDMPLQINNSEDDGWKIKVAKWRLQIGK
jgi:hypothetical protein